jgi:phage gp46-like protein
MLSLRWNNEVGAARLQKTDLGALATDSSLESVVLLSLFTDSEASQEEIKSAGLDRQQGWWADADSLREPGVRRRGSKLWLLSRGKTTLETLRRCEWYIRDSLQWLVDAGIISTIAVVTTRPRPGIVGIDLTLTRPSKLLPAYRRLWEVRHDAFI